MTIKLDQTTLEDCDPTPAVNRWWIDTTRTRRFTSQYGSRKQKGTSEESNTIPTATVTVQCTGSTVSTSSSSISQVELDDYDYDD